MIGTDTISRVIGQDVYDESGEKIGSAAEVYLDDETGQPEWVTVRTGLFGTKESFVPIRERRPDRRRRPRTREQGAGEGRPEDRHRRPPVAAGGAGALPLLRHRRGHRHRDRHRHDADRGDRHDHGRTDRTRHDRTTGVDTRGTVGHDTSGPTTDNAMTRSEERLNVGTRSEEVGRARLRKYVVTENVTETVPVSREEVRVEREPITDANIGNAMDGPAISEEEHEVDPPRRDPGRGEGGRAGRARPPGHRDRHRAGHGHRGRPQGADRGRRRRRDDRDRRI